VTILCRLSLSGPINPQRRCNRSFGLLLHSQESAAASVQATETAPERGAQTRVPYRMEYIITLTVYHPRTYHERHRSTLLNHRTHRPGPLADQTRWNGWRILFATFFNDLARGSDDERGDDDENCMTGHRGSRECRGRDVHVDVNDNVVG
jgi:hypothetical protein